MIFGQLRMIMTMVIVAGLAGGVIYVNKLRSDNAILKANQLKLEAVSYTHLTLPTIDRV